VSGVARDIRHYGLDQPPRPTVFLPWTMQLRDTVPSGNNMAIVVETVGAAEPLMSLMRAAVARLDPALPVFQLTTMKDAVSRSLGLVRTTAALLAVFAGVSLLLAVGGLHGVLTYTVSRRQRDIGIRMALGASRSAIVRAVVGHGLGLVAIGLALGVPAVFAAQRLGSGFLSIDAAPSWGMLAGAALLVVMAGAASAFVPARRASRFDARGALGGE
jgi:ABC-type antimicrobial peptide transport system permease subunit